MKNNKGFTLIELMIAIAIIGILALVLIPRVAGLKDSAREQGLDTNVRMGLSVAESLLDDYTANEAGAVAIEAALDTKLPADAKNPFTKEMTVRKTNDAVPADALALGNAAFAYTDNSASTDEAIEQVPATNTDQPGVVMYDAYVIGGKLIVKFTPCDKTGAPITADAKTTN